MKENIQLTVDDLATLCLDSPEYHGYEDFDLMNAVLVFSHFLMDSVYKNNQHLSLTKQCELAETTGKAVRELILASTGKDTHKLFKKTA